MPIITTIGGSSIRGFRGGSDGLFPFTTYTFTSAKTAPLGAGSYYNPTYLGDGQSLIVPKDGIYRFKAVAIADGCGGTGANAIQGDYSLLKGDLLMCVCGSRFRSGCSNGQGGDMTGIGIYRSSAGIWGNYEPIVLSGGMGANNTSIGAVQLSTAAITTNTAGGVDGDGGGSWTTRSYPRNGGAFAGYPFILGYGGGGAVGIDGDGDGATGGAGGYSSGYGGTSGGGPGTSCINVNCTNTNTANREVTTTPYVTMTFIA